MFELTNGQKELCDLVVKWFNSEKGPDFVYTGAAGTGKTSIVPVIIERLGLRQDEVLYVAYTGKAASVLMQKGFNASTIHSAFYDAVDVPLLDKHGEKVYKNGRLMTKVNFVPKKYIDKKIKLIFIDEWSMVNKEFADTIYSYRIPILAAGDKHQLKPIYGESPFASKIQYELTEITRQSKYSGIVTLATMIRNDEELPVYHNFYNDAHIMPKKLLNDELLLKADIILTAKNKSRNAINSRIRYLHKSNGKVPCMGDKLINRKNNWTMSLDGIPLVNGIIGKCVNPVFLDEREYKKGIYRMDFQPDYCDDDYYDFIPCDLGFLNSDCGDKEIDYYNYGLKFEYAEAITVHLSQGSQYDTVIFLDEYMKDREFLKQLRYTAVTRAVKRVFMFT